jgi:autotransporter adhesin
VAGVSGLSAEDLQEIQRSAAHDRRDSRQGIAAALAMGSASMPSGPGRTSYAVNGTSYRGQRAVGGSVMYRLNTTGVFAITGGVSYGGHSNTAARIGIAGEF